jgi:hypothetical protein
MTTESGGGNGRTTTESEPAPASNVSLEEWLDDQEAERQALIMRLRQVEKNLIRYGRLRKGTLPEKVRQQGRI